MEDIAWKRDETPYIVFACSKCRQYIYAKTTQKSKKCARCGRTHAVNNILESGEVVLGISTAVELVKKRQDEFAIKELGTRPAFRSSNDFTITQSIDKDEEISKEEGSNDEYRIKFKQMLIHLSNRYENFPLYIIEIMAENYGVPESEIKLLIRSFQKQGILKRLKDNLFQVKIG